MYTIVGNRKKTLNCGLKVPCTVTLTSQLTQTQCSTTQFLLYQSQWTQQSVAVLVGWVSPILHGLYSEQSQ